jgi:hypothetical protein
VLNGKEIAPKPSPAGRGPRAITCARGAPRAAQAVGPKSGLLHYSKKLAFKNRDCQTLGRAATLTFPIERDACKTTKGSLV